jgi:O-antigen/teichoic acid export membrane protein
MNYKKEVFISLIFKPFELIIGLFLIRFLNDTFTVAEVASYFLLISFVEFTRLAFIGQESQIRNELNYKQYRLPIYITGIFWSLAFVLFYFFELKIKNFNYNFFIIIIPLLISFQIVLESEFFIKTKSFLVGLVSSIQKLVLLILASTLVGFKIFDIYFLSLIVFILITPFFINVKYLKLPKKADYKLFLKKSSSFSIIGAATAINSGIDVWLINNFLETKDVFDYSISLRIIALVFILNSLISTPIWNQLKNNAVNKKTIFKVYNQLTAFVIFIGFLIVSFMELFADLILNIDLEVPFLHKIVWLTYIVITNRMGWINQYFNSIGLAKFRSKINTVYIILNIPLSIYLINMMGYIGAVISTVLLMIIVYIVQELYLKKITTYV